MVMVDDVEIGQLQQPVIVVVPARRHREQSRQKITLVQRRPPSQIKRRLLAVYTQSTVSKSLLSLIFII